MNTVGKILGAGSGLCFIPLGIKYPARRLGCKRADAALMKMHEGASAAFWLLGIIHMFFGRNARGASKLLKRSGSVALGISTWLITDCHMAKNVERKMKRHRIYSLVLALSMLIHFFTAKKK